MGLSRRGFLKALGISAGAAAVGAQVVQAETVRLEVVTETVSPDANFPDAEYPKLYRAWGSTYYHSAGVTHEPV